MKTKPSEWEKMFANEATDKGLISKIYKLLVKINNIHTQITQSKKWAEDHFDIFPKKIYR